MTLAEALREVRETGPVPGLRLVSETPWLDWTLAQGVTLWVPYLAAAARVLEPAAAPVLAADPRTGPMFEALHQLEATGIEQGLLPDDYKKVERVAEFFRAVFAHDLPKAYIRHALWIEPGATTGELVRHLGRLLGTINDPPALVALYVSALFPYERRTDRFLLGQAPYKEMAEAFRGLAARHGVKGTEAAYKDGLAFWREQRGSELLRLMVDGSAALQPATPARAPNPPSEARLQASLAQRTEEVALLREQLRMERLDAERLRRDLMTAKAALARARRRGERAVEFARRVRERGRADGRTGGRTEGRSDGQTVRRSEALGEAGQDSGAPRGQSPPDPAASEADRPTVRPSDRLLERPAILAGKTVYLYTSLEDMGAARELVKSVELAGAECHLFDANHASARGPEHFAPETLVIINVRQLSHVASEEIAARARASGTWYYLGTVGPRTLVRRVEERWWETHRVEGGADGRAVS